MTYLTIAYLLCLGIFYTLAETAPFGYEDDEGFHYGTQK